MSYATEHIAESLRAARERKGLSQRALSAKAGVPQSHISKIENGAVDLRLSSLVELARVLDLEFVLVPRKSVPAIKAIATNLEGGKGYVERTAHLGDSALRRLQKQIADLPSDVLSEIPGQELQRRARDLTHFRLRRDDLAIIKEASEAIGAFKSDPQNLRLITEAQNKLRILRNTLAHGEETPATRPRPAYRLDGDADDHGDDHG